PRANRLRYEGPFDRPSTRSRAPVRRRDRNFPSRLGIRLFPHVRFGRGRLRARTTVTSPDFPADGRASDDRYPRRRLFAGIERRRRPASTRVGARPAQVTGGATLSDASRVGARRLTGSAAGQLSTVSWQPTRFTANRDPQRPSLPAGTHRPHRTAYPRSARRRADRRSVGRSRAYRPRARLASAPPTLYGRCPRIPSARANPT